MKRIKLLFCLMLISLILPINQLSAQQRISFDNWKITNFSNGKASEANSTGITLRTNSPATLEGLNYDAAPLTIVCKWLNPLNYVDMGVRLYFYYQNGAYEIVDQNIPKGDGSEKKLTFIPKNGAGKKLVKLEFQHGSTGMEIKILSIELGGGASCSDRIQSINNDFGNLIEEMKRNMVLNDAYIKKLENMLNAYKAVK